MKKLLSLILCFLLAVPAASSLAQQTEGYSAEAYSHLVQLGLVDGAGEMDPDYIVTRGEFAGMVKKLMNMGSAGDAGAILNFSDVEMNDPDYGSIAFCVSMGYMKGYGDGTFRPAQPIGGHEAVKVALSLLGYDLAAHYRGGYPYGYLDVANEISLLRGCRITEDYLRKGALLQLTYNLLKAYPNELSSITEDTETYRPGTQTFAQRNLKLTFLEGVAEGDFTLSLTDVSGLGEDQLLVGQRIFRLENAWQKGLVGMRVSLFFDDEANEIASIAPADDKNNMLTVKSGMFLSYGDQKLLYEVDERAVSLRLPADLKCVYNNSFVMSFDFAQLGLLPNADVRFVDNDNDSQYDVAFISAYENYVVSTIYSKNTVGDRIDPSRRLSLEETGEKEILILDSERREMEFSEIEVDDVLSVLENEQLMLVIVNQSSVGGEVQEFTDSEIVIGGKAFPLSKAYRGSVAPGMNVTVYFDCYGDGIFIRQNGVTEFLTGYLIDGIAPKSEFESMRLQVFLSTGSFGVYTLADKYKINGETWKGRSFAPALCTDVSGQIKRQPIQYKLDTLGQIKDILTPKDTLEAGEDGFFKSVSIGTAKPYQTNLASIDGKIYMNSNTLIMQVPQNETETDETMFDVIPLDKLPYTSYIADAYQYSVKSQWADLVIIKGNASPITFDSGTAVFDSLSVAMDSEGEIASVLEYYADGTPGKCFVDTTKFPTLLQLEKGDVFRYAIKNSKDYLSDFVWYYDYSEDRWVTGNNPTDSNMFASFRVAKGYAAAIQGDILRLSYTQDYPEDSSVYGLDGYLLSKFKVTVIERDASRILVRQGTAADLNVGDKICVTARSGTGMTLIIYKD